MTAWTSFDAAVARAGASMKLGRADIAALLDEAIRRGEIGSRSQNPFPRLDDIPDLTHSFKNSGLDVCVADLEEWLRHSSQLLGIPAETPSQDLLPASQAAVLEAVAACWNGGEIPKMKVQARDDIIITWLKKNRNMTVSSKTIGRALASGQ